MERDFFGLGSKNSPITVKEEETSESSRDSAPARGMNWSFSNKVSAPSSQFLSFRASQEDRQRKSGNYHHHHLPHSSSFMPSSVAASDVYDSNRKTPYSSIQGVRTFPNSSQQVDTTAVSMSMPSFHSHYAPGGKSFMNPQPLAGVPIMAPPISILPPPGSIVGTTEIRSSTKPVGSPAPLTIFYAGSVCVYDDVSPDKAKAIMLLAGNGSSLPQAFSSPPQTHQHAVHHTRASVDSSSAMPPSYIPTISHLSPEAGSSTNGLGAAKATRGLMPSTWHNNQTNINSSVAVSCSNNNVVAPPTVALPIARKASLARFLEKRKERVASASPYCLDKKSSTDCRTPMSECISSSLSSAT